MRERERWDYGIKIIYGSQEHEAMFHKNAFTPRRPTPSSITVARKRA